MKWLKTLWLGLTTNADGTFSSTKFWQSVGYIAATYALMLLAHSGKLSADFYLIYLGAVTAARSFQNYLVARGKDTSYAQSANAYQASPYGYGGRPRGYLPDVVAPPEPSQGERAARGGAKAE